MIYQINLKHYDYSYIISVLKFMDIEFTELKQPNILDYEFIELDDNIFGLLEERNNETSDNETSDISYWFRRALKKVYDMLNGLDIIDYDEYEKRIEKDVG